MVNLLETLEAVEGLAKKYWPSSTARKLLHSDRWQTIKDIVSNASISIHSIPSNQEKEKNISTKKEKEIREVFNTWVDLKHKHYGSQSGPEYKLTYRRAYLIAQRLEEGFSVKELQRAIHGCFSNEFNVNKGFTNLELILRNDDKVRQYISWYKNIKIRDKPDGRQYSGPTPIKNVLEEWKPNE